MLVDSSVWIGHLKRRNEQLVAALELGLVGSHPFVIGEIALGSLGPRHQVVADLGRLRAAPLARHDEVMRLVERERLAAANARPRSNMAGPERVSPRPRRALAWALMPPSSRCAQPSSACRRLRKGSSCSSAATPRSFPLMALAKALSGLEGRKAILLFSEGFQVPASADEAFRSTISEANRANVSFYAIDSRRTRHEPRAGGGGRGARQGGPHESDGDGQARRRRHLDRRGDERRPRAVLHAIERPERARRAGRKHGRLSHRQHERSAERPGTRHQRPGELLRDCLRAAGR